MKGIGPYARRVGIPGGLGIDPSVLLGQRAMAKSTDLAVVWAHPQVDLTNVCNCVGTDVVQLYANTTYQITDMSLTRGVTIIGSPGVVIQGLANGANPKMSIDTSDATSIVRIIGNGMKVKCPVECNSRAHLHHFEIDTALTTSHGAKVEISGANAAKSALGELWSDNADPLGMLVRDAAVNTMVGFCDYSLHTTALSKSGLTVLDSAVPGAIRP